MRITIYHGNTKDYTDDVSLKTHRCFKDGIAKVKANSTLSPAVMSFNTRSLSVCTTYSTIHHSLLHCQVTRVGALQHVSQNYTIYTKNRFQLQSKRPVALQNRIRNARR